MKLRPTKKSIGSHRDRALIGLNMQKQIPNEISLFVIILSLGQIILPLMFVSL